MELPEPGPDIDLTMDRPLFDPPLEAADRRVARIRAEEALRTRHRSRTCTSTRTGWPASPSGAPDPPPGLAQSSWWTRTPGTGTGGTGGVFQPRSRGRQRDHRRHPATDADMDRPAGHVRQATLPLVVFCRARRRRRHGMTTGDPAPHALSFVLIALMRGVMERENDPALWQSLLDLQARIRDHVAVLGLELILDEAKAMGICASSRETRGTPSCPVWCRAVSSAIRSACCWPCCARSSPSSMQPAASTRLILSRDEIVDMVRLFLPDTANQARLHGPDRRPHQQDRRDGLPAPLARANGQFEVRRILKAFVDAQWLGELDGRLAAYRVMSTDDTPG